MHSPKDTLSWTRRPWTPQILGGTHTRFSGRNQHWPGAEAITICGRLPELKRCQRRDNGPDPQQLLTPYQPFSRYNVF